MIKEIVLDGKKIEYEFNIKNVKNVNLRIKSDGSIFVSANRFVPEKFIEEFLKSKKDFIFKALENFENIPKKEKIQHFGSDEIKNVIVELCDKVYPYFKEKGVKFPKIRFKKMVSQWGNCNPKKGILTFNLNLMYAPLECIEYVVIHEFTHFLQPNHQSGFYRELEKLCPKWKVFRRKLASIDIRGSLTDEKMQNNGYENGKI